MELFHGSINSNLSKISSFGTMFDGLFASNDFNAAASHGSDFVYQLEIGKEKALTNYALNYDLDYDAVKQAFIAATDIEEDAHNFDDAWKAVIEDRAEFGHTTFAEDAAESSWEAQRLRGHVARKLGYDAVEMNDEHGTSWLVLNAQIKKIA